MAKLSILLLFVTCFLAASSISSASVQDPERVVEEVHRYKFEIRTLHLICSYIYMYVTRTI